MKRETPLMKRAFIGLLALFLLLAACRPPAGPENTPSPLPAAPTAVPTGTLAPTATPVVGETAVSTSEIYLPITSGQEATATPPPTPLPTDTAVPPTPAPTIPPPPTPTPYISYIPELPPPGQLGPSKLGLHVNRPNNPEIMEFVRQARPAVMKGVGDLGWLADVKAVSPQTVTIGRIPVENQDYGGNPEEAARRLVAEQLQEYLLNPYVDYWEGWNEPDPGLERMAWYARFEQERVRQLAQYGLRAAIGGFSTGVPEMDEFAQFLPAVETAVQNNGILTLHEYSAPDITYGFRAPLPGYPPHPDRGALMFRYRWYYEELLKPAGLVIPLVISEAGIDGLVGPRPGPEGQGWQDFQDFSVAQGWGENGTEAFVRQIAWYDAGTRQDEYVIGFALFTAGGGRRWPSYDLDPILPDLAAYVNGQ